MPTAPGLKSTPCSSRTPPAASASCMSCDRWGDLFCRLLGPGVSWQHLSPEHSCAERVGAERCGAGGRDDHGPLLRGRQPRSLAGRQPSAGPAADRAPGRAGHGLCGCSTGPHRQRLHGCSWLCRWQHTGHPWRTTRRCIHWALYEYNRTACRTRRLC